MTTTTNAANQVNPIKIIITTRESSNILEVMNFIYSITSLIYPFKYCGDILPFCDEIKVFEHLINNRHTSSVIGFLQKDYSFEKYLNSTNVIIFDFDSSKILNNLKEFKLISLPKENRVLTMLKNNISKYDTNIRIMDFFVKCMASWFGNYRHHFKLHSNLFEFDHSRFITDEHHSIESNDFYKAFSCTHLYKIFIDERTKLVNDYQTFQIQKIQFGRFEQECFKINPRIFTNASTNVSLTSNNSSFNNNSNTNNNTNNTNTTTTNGTITTNQSLNNTNSTGNNSTTTQSLKNNQSNNTGGGSNNNTSKNNNNSGGGNNGFSLKHLFFKKNSNNNQTNQSSINELPEDKNDKNNDIEPMSPSFGTKVIGELQFSKENQLSLSFYCRESDSTKTKFSFSEFHQTIKPPKKYLPEFGEQSIVTKEDVESGDSKIQSDLDTLLDVNDNSSETTSECAIDEDHSTLESTESFNIVDNESIIMVNESDTSIDKVVEIPPLTSTTITATTTTTCIPVTTTADEFYD
ncbi:predicted protein [Naegleria gruberi]|uniref:Predicted protein n=1 Tax=Naegleria gruberi TaxID=5762 RepID=D2VAG6_NAEGR|nr:uncharacterized protein NAEGRDRAFT_65852 [Naegleria gruberi]EFC46067.1 predicted protein [Naegleria gruberi]|eukprot:XP_002678811.1 predicted protein [Naegleria gruberi strain NEG-M]